MRNLSVLRVNLNMRGENCVGFSVIFVTYSGRCVRKELEDMKTWCFAF